MGHILRKWRIPGAIIIALVLISGAYVLAKGIASPPMVTASEESDLLAAIAAKDTDQDGLIDWEEALYGTDPKVRDTKKLGMSDSEAVTKGLIVPKAIADIALPVAATSTLNADGLPPPPASGTLTALFARNLFTRYLEAKERKGNESFSPGELNAIVSEALASLSREATPAPAYKQPADIVIAESGKEALIAYAKQVEVILTTNTANATTTQTKYLKRAIEQGDVTAIPHIASLAKAYRASAVGIAALSVPRELAAAHLALINSLMRIAALTQDFTLVNEDPLTTVLALERYPQAVQNMGLAFLQIGQVYALAGITLPSGTAGATVVNLNADIVAGASTAL